MPLLWQHKHDQPVGCQYAKPTKTGIPFRARIATAIAVCFQDRLDEVWQSMLRLSCSFDRVLDRHYES